MALKAVIFDFGGVLVRTRSQSLRQAWEQRLGLAPGQASQIVFGGEMGTAAQLGRITDEEHWRWIGQRLGLDQGALEQFRHDFFAMDDLDEELLAYVDRLRERYTVGLLSNASSRARHILTERYRVTGHFDHVTISAEEGVMKPDPRIYRIALARAGAQPHEAVFVDDFQENIEAARALGMMAVHFADPLEARRELAALTGVS